MGSKPRLGGYYFPNCNSDLGLQTPSRHQMSQETQNSFEINQHMVGFWGVTPNKAGFPTK
jgi:hypothetical protein